MEEKFLNESDAWFYRNKSIIVAKGEVSEGTKLASEFIEKSTLDIDWSKERILEIGACYGYNLKYLADKFDVMCYGIDPSGEAVKYGNEKFKNINLVQGSAENLPYNDEKFYIVIMGFCMYEIERRYLMRVVSEADRVLKEGGYLMLVDFDTYSPYKRRNIHNSEMWTYKMQYINLFLSNPQYCLVYKKSFSDNGMWFCKEIQERISFNVLYKDVVNNIYING